MEFKEQMKFEGWKQLTLKDIGKIVSGGTPSTQESRYWGDEVAWITPADLSGYQSKFIAKGRKSISKEGLVSSSAKLIPKGSVLFSSRAPIGYVVIAANELATNQGFKNIIPNELIKSEYLFYYLKASKKLVEDRASGTTFKEISASKFAEIPIPVPPLEQQESIVLRIEELFSELDKSIEDLKTAQQQLKVYRQSVLHWAFEGKLTNGHVSDGSLVRIQSGSQTENGSWNQNPMGSQAGEQLPEGWKWLRIDEICEVVRGGSPRPAGDPKYYDGDIPFLKVADLTKSENVYLTTYTYSIKEAGLKKTRQVEPETLLISNSGATLGVPKICKIKATINDGIAAFLNLDPRSNLYLYYFWKSKTKELRNIDQGAAQPNLNTNLLKSYKIPYCSFEEQQIVVKEIETRLSVADKLEETISQSLQQAEALRQSILKQAFEGEL